MVLHTYKWSIEEWHELVETGLLEGKPVEFLEGEIVEMSPEGIEHSYTNNNVAKYLRKILQDLADVRESHPITLDNSEPEPDIAIVKLPETIYRSHHPYPEDIYWLIEISNRTLKKAEQCGLGGFPAARSADRRLTTTGGHSPAQQLFQEDLEQKIITYARNGIPEYWVIDLVNKKLIVHTQVQKNSYAQIVEYKVGTVSPLAFPEIAIALDKLLLF